MPKAEARMPLRHLHFVILSTFGIRHFLLALAAGDGKMQRELCEHNADRVSETCHWFARKQAG
jgi:hypothetical protein